MMATLRCKKSKVATPVRACLCCPCDRGEWDSSAIPTCIYSSPQEGMLGTEAVGQRIHGAVAARMPHASGHVRAALCGVA